ncbi:catenin delta-1 isoform X3 [Hemiscyllium ocellatum]|uniref:catenin delta-1 isoform X3 n=1 Tax=Hemiscyllium ocellatum TaxID=170820 RepID=UPI002965D758|nr:catenin delta-1 isoform X3 [Hemiscyllium ocellatum]
MDDSDVESTASILASVKEQEIQFERLTRALENERRGVSLQLQRVKLGPDGIAPTVANGNGTLSWRWQTRNGIDPCDAERECLLPLPLRVNRYEDHQLTHSSATMMQDPSPYFEETVTVEEDPEHAPSVVSVETDEDGTTRRTETTVKKVIKTVTTRTVHEMPGDPFSGDGSSVQGGYTQTLDRKFRSNGETYLGPHGSSTVPRGYSYQEVYGKPPAQRVPYADLPPEGYSSLSRGVRIDQRYQPPVEGYQRAPGRMDVYGAQPQVRAGSNFNLNQSHPERFPSEPYGLEDDERSVGYDDAPDYGLAHDYPTAKRSATPSDLRNRYFRRSFDDPLADDMRSEHDAYYWAPLAQQERAGSMASLHSGRKEPVAWRRPELPEVIAMLNYKLDAVKANAAAYLQHLTYRNDKLKTEVRRLKGIPVLVEMLDHPKKEVHHAACGALKNIAYGRDADNKKAIKNCDGVPSLVRLLRKARDMDLNEVITGTLWNLSSHDAVKMEIVDHAVPALCDEVIIPHSGWDQEPNEDSKPRHVEWQGVLTNTAGCLRNVSSEKKEARQKLRECSGLVDSLMHIVQSEIDQKDVDSKLVENCVCLLRNLSFQVHREIPDAARFQDPVGGPSVPAGSSQPKASCFGSKKGKGRKGADDPTADVDIPKRSTPAKGYELLYQPEVVRLYLSLMKESKNPAVLEAVAGALQNLCAGRWTYGRYIRLMVRQEKGLSCIAERLTHENDRVVKAVSGALRNLSLDARNKELIGKHAMPNLVFNLPSSQQSAPARNDDTVVSILQTINEVVIDNVEAAKKLRELQGVEKLVLMNKSSSRSEREIKAVGTVLQTLWGYKELRKQLEKDGWKKADFQVTSANRGVSGNAYDDSTLPLIEKDQRGGDKREMIPMDDLGPDAYSTLDRRDQNRTLDRTLDRSGDYSEREPLKGDPYPISTNMGSRGSVGLLESYRD